MHAYHVLRVVIIMCSLYSRIVMIKAFSHQGYPISYELTTESGAQSRDFAIDRETGKVCVVLILAKENVLIYSTRESC